MISSRLTKHVACRHGARRPRSRGIFDRDAHSYPSSADKDRSIANRESSMEKKTTIAHEYI